jgi:hypothetical protein
LPAQLGVQQLPAVVQVWPGVQAQSCAQLLQFSPVWQPFTPHLISGMHAPSVQSSPSWHIPQVPPQPSLPQCLPAQSGAQQAPRKQTLGAHGQSPVHELPQSSPGSQAWFPQVDDTTHSPFEQICCPSHLPQVPPQPSSPHFLPLQLGVQHLASMQEPPAHAQSPGHDSHVSFVSHLALPQKACSTHRPELHRDPLGHEPHCRMWPHPSGTEPHLVRASPHIMGMHGVPASPPPVPRLASLSPPP